MKKHLRLLNNLRSKLSLMDGILLGLVLTVLVVIIVFSKREVKFTTIRLKITDEEILYAAASPAVEYANSFIVGDSEKNELGQKTAEITRIEAYNTAPSKKVVILDISVKATYNPRKNQFSLKGKAINYGSSLSFNFEKVKVKGLVVDFPEFDGAVPVKEHKVVVKTQLRWENRAFSDVYGVPDYVARSVKVGDVVTDSQGKVLAKILEVKTQPAQRTLFSNGNAVLVNDPLLKDVFYTIELSTKVINDRMYMYDFLPVQIDQAVPLNFAQISLFPVITAFQ